MRAMKDSGIAWIGEIPADWTKTRIGNLFRFSSGDSLTNEEIQDEGLYKVYGANGPRGYYHHSNLAGKHILIGRVGALCGNVHVVNEAVWATEHALIAEQISSNIYTDFAARVFESMNLGQYSKASAQPVIASSVVQRLQIPIPPFSEQHRIADYLDRKCSQIDAIIARQQEVIEKLKAYKLSVITEAVTKGLNPHAPMKDSGVEWIGEIPEHWEVRKAAFICDRLVVGVVIKPAEYFDDKGTIPFLRGINLKEYSINTDNLVYITDETNKMLSKSIVRSGDILIVRDGNIGVACVVPPFLDGANVVSMIIMTPMKRYNSCYICYFINSSIGKLQFELTKIGSALTHTSVSAVSKLRLAIPPEEEQNKIVEFLDEKCSSIEMLISKKQVIVDNLIAYKKSLIYEVVTGKKEV